MPRSESAIDEKETLQTKVQELNNTLGEAKKTLEAAGEGLARRKEGAEVQNKRSSFNLKRYFSLALFNLGNAQAAFDNAKKKVQDLAELQIKLITTQAKNILEEFTEILPELKKDENHEIVKIERSLLQLQTNRDNALEQWESVKNWFSEETEDDKKRLQVIETFLTEMKDTISAVKELVQQMKSKLEELKAFEIAAEKIKKVTGFIANTTVSIDRLIAGIDANDAKRCEKASRYLIDATYRLKLANEIRTTVRELVAPSAENDALRQIDEAIRVAEVNINAIRTTLTALFDPATINQMETTLVARDIATIKADIFKLSEVHLSALEMNIECESPAINDQITEASKILDFKNKLTSAVADKANNLDILETDPDALTNINNVLEEGKQQLVAARGKLNRDVLRNVIANISISIVRAAERDAPVCQWPTELSHFWPLILSHFSREKSLI